MGYRSDIVIALNKEIYTKHAVLLKDLPEILQECKCEFNDKGVYWRLESLKWYEGYKDVDECMAFLKKLGEDNPMPNPFEEGWSEPYGFMRMGENADDIEYGGEPYDFDMSIYRAIEYPGNN